jgi:hypothetical protein
MVRAAIVVLVVALVPVGARADLPPSNGKRIETSIRVDGELPAGKALVLDNTFEGADPIPVGVAVGFRDGRHGDRAQLFLVGASAIPRIDELRYAHDGDGIDAILGHRMCGSPFEVNNVIAFDSPVVERRYNLAFTVVDDRCVARLVSVELIDAAQQVIGPDPEVTIVAPPEPSPAPPPTVTAEPQAANPSATEEQPRGLCRVDAPATPPVLFGLVALVRRRPKRSR